MGKVIIVDDHEDIVLTLKKIVEKQGHSVFTAKNGQDFLDKVVDINPDLIFLDVMMPGLVTKDILDEIKNKKLDQIPIVFISVVNFSDEEKNSLKNKANVVEFILKPFSINEILMILKKHIK